MGLNFLKKNDSDHAKILKPPNGHNLSIKNNLSGSKPRYKGWFIIDFLLLLYQSRYKNSKKRLRFADISPGTDPIYAA